MNGEITDKVADARIRYKLATNRRLVALLDEDSKIMREIDEYGKCIRIGKRCHFTKSSHALKELGLNPCPQGYFSSEGEYLCSLINYAEQQTKEEGIKEPEKEPVLVE